MDAKNAREILKVLLTKENLSLTKLAQMLSSDKKKIYQQTLSDKLIKGNLKFDEMVKICDLLGYEIEFNKK